MKIAVLGAGSWGGALSMVLAQNQHEVWLWSPNQDEIDKIAQTRRLLHKLPEVVLPESIHPEVDPSRFLRDVEMLVVAVPSKYIRSFGESFAPHILGAPKVVVSATKGLEVNTLSTMSAVLEETWRMPLHNELLSGIVALSGPSHAEEVARYLPTAVVAACPNPALAECTQAAFQTPRFRVYTHTDRVGVEIGAALKNVLAVAVGISDGLGFGDNARAALISRGLYELSQIGVRMGAKLETFAGLSGMGDLVVTCTSRHSRNRRFGELLARGYDTDNAEEEIGMVVEGISTVQAVPGLVEQHRVEMPIAQEVFRIVMENADPRQSVENLMMRQSKPEQLF